MIDNIFQSRNWVNSSAQGSKLKVTRRHGAKFSDENSRKMRFWNAQTGGERWITFILIFSDLCIQHYQLPLPVICFKNVHYRRKPFRDNLQNAAPNSNYHKKSTNSPRVQQSMFMLLYALIISFPVRHTANFRFDGRHCIGDIMANAMVRKLLYSEFDR